MAPNTWKSTAIWEEKSGEKPSRVGLLLGQVLERLTGLGEHELGKPHSCQLGSKYQAVSAPHQFHTHWTTALPGVPSLLTYCFTRPAVDISQNSLTLPSSKDQWNPGELWVSWLSDFHLELLLMERKAQPAKDCLEAKETQAQCQ